MLAESLKMATYGSQRSLNQSSASQGNRQSPHRKMASSRNRNRSKSPSSGEAPRSKSPVSLSRQVTINESLGTGGQWTDSDKDDRDEEEALPSINERLAYLRPSRELLEYYRKKIGEFDAEHDDMVKKMETYKMTYEEQHKVQWEIRQREEEIAELQKALSDMQVYLFQEREHVLRLYAENDRLKIRELEDRKKIHTLLQLSGMTESEVSYFMKEPPAKAIVEQKLPKKLQNDLANRNTTSTVPGPKVHKKKSGGVSMGDQERGTQDNQLMLLQIEALQAQLQEQSKVAKEQLDSMLEDRRVRIEETETQRQRDDDKIQMLTDKLHKTQDLLYASTQDFLKLRYDHRRSEREMMADRDKILRELDACRQQLSIGGGGGGGGGSGSRGGLTRDAVLDMSADMMETRMRREEEFKSLNYQLQQAQKMAEMYREQVIQLEDELAKIREEGDIGKDLFKERSEKMAKRLALMNQRYTDLERRRNLEVEGFKTDIKNLRGRLKELEKQLYKVTIGMQEELNEKRPDDIDMQILRNVRRTAGRSKELVDELKTLKAKVYGMESDLRHL